MAGPKTVERAETRSTRSGRKEKSGCRFRRARKDGSECARLANGRRRIRAERRRAGFSIKLNTLPMIAIGMGRW